MERPEALPAESGDHFRSVSHGSYDAVTLLPVTLGSGARFSTLGGLPVENYPGINWLPGNSRRQHSRTSSEKFAKLENLGWIFERIKDQ
jgi:hypothetical protein